MFPSSEQKHLSQALLMFPVVVLWNEISCTLLLCALDVSPMKSIPSAHAFLEIVTNRLPVVLPGQRGDLPV